MSRIKIPTFNSPTTNQKKDHYPQPQQQAVQQPH